jgi:hypothetical protein
MLVEHQTVGGLTHALVLKFLANFFNFFDRREPLFNGVVAGEGVRSHMREILPLAPPA